MKKQAFTLAEVLLVLGIIGVIASVTIPTVTTSNQNKKFAALTRKAQSTLQGAIDNKMAYVLLKRPEGDNLMTWLTSDANFGHDTIKYVAKDGEVLTTPDGMVFFADRTSPSTSGKLKYAGKVYVDLNGAEGPTKTTIDNGESLSEVAENIANFDVVYFDISRDGDVQINNANTKVKQYLEMK